ncbi:DUF7109 family protein [Haloglomus litoreum]|uniref:DUF7109 family protein n=1 Tax=Haloglomus litoreum TaxID=3034026 RepID=UPI0023E759F5|nr:hypothetical protein [Haloglomus sp. DT116]
MTDHSDDGSDDPDDPERLDLSLDEVAGIVDLFGGLTRAELTEALEELAFRRGVEPPPDDRVDQVVRAYSLVEYPREDDDGVDGDAADPLLVPGPSAFPTLPDGAADLPHILDIESRAVDRERLGRAVEERFRGDVARAVADEDEVLVGRLLDVSYDLETWGPVELGDLRERLDAARE